MPRGDGTGPDGKGTRTGRGLGNCPPQDNENKAVTPIVRGAGFGRGRRRI